MTSDSVKYDRDLRHACRLWAIQPEYFDFTGHLVSAEKETLHDLLRAVSGFDTEGKKAIQDLIQLGLRREFSRTLSPVNVIWKEDRAHTIRFKLEDRNQPLSRHRIRIQAENGESNELDIKKSRKIRECESLGEKYAVYELPIFTDLKTGYYKVKIENSDSREEASLFVALREIGPNKKAQLDVPKWGIFAPLYALKNESDWGMGDLHSLREMSEFVSGLGGNFFGTLPILSSICEKDDCDPSPYSPYSKLFWNELFLDLPGLIKESGMDIKQIKTSSGESFQSELQRLRASELVQFSEVGANKKEILLQLSEHFFASGKNDGMEFREFLVQQPEIISYSRYRSGNDQVLYRYHLYVQFQMNKLLSEMKKKAVSGAVAGLYLDFPLGVSRSGFDAHRFKKSFLFGANAGAPPDQLFLGGQNWGFAPLHPFQIRETGYEYFIQCMRQHMKNASLLRVDHIMSFHRIYAIPLGLSSKDGAYIRYRPEEFYSILSIEAERAGVKVVGEDLGTVPKAVRENILKHNCSQMWVLPFEAGKNPEEAIEKAPIHALACMNTHDMSPFEGFVRARDVKLLSELGFLDHKTEQEILDERNKTLAAWKKLLEIHSEDGWELYLSLIRRMAKSKCEILLINLEDLWSETEPQNIPGTWKEYPNWRRKARQSFKQIASDSRIVGVLQEINGLRKGLVE